MLLVAAPGAWADHHEVVIIEETVRGTDVDPADEENLPSILFADHYGNVLAPRAEGGGFQPALLSHGELFYVLVQYEKDPERADIPVVLHWGNSQTQTTARKTEQATIFQAGPYQVEAPSSNVNAQPGVARVLKAAKGAMITAEAEGFAADLIVDEPKVRIVVRSPEETNGRASLASLNTEQPFKVDVHVPRPRASSIGETLVITFKTKRDGSSGSLRVSAAGAGGRGPVVYGHRSTLTLAAGGEGEGRTPTDEVIWGLLPDSMLTPFTDYDLYKMDTEKEDVLVVSYENTSLEIPVYWSWRQQRLAQLIAAFEGLRQFYSAGLSNGEVTREAKAKLDRKLSLIKNLDKILAVPIEQLDDIRRLVIVEAYFRMIQDDPDNWDADWFGPGNFRGTRNDRFGIVYTSNAEAQTLNQAIAAGRREYQDRFIGFARDLTIGSYQLITQVTGANQVRMIFTATDAMGRHVNMSERVLAGIDLVSQAAMMGASSLKALNMAREGAGGLERARLAGKLKATEGSDAGRAALNRVLDPTGTRPVPRRIASSNETLPANHSRYVEPSPTPPRSGTNTPSGPARSVGTVVETPNNVAPIRQQETSTTCGEATAGTTIERITGQDVPEANLARWADDAGRTEPGTWPRQMEEMLNQHGVDTRVPYGRRFPESEINATGGTNVPRRLDDPGARTVAPDPKLAPRFTTADAAREIRDGNQVLTVVSYSRGRGQTDPTPHWVIVEKVDTGKITRSDGSVYEGSYVVIGDPAVGKSVAIPHDDFVRHWNPESTVIAVHPKNTPSVPLPTRPITETSNPMMASRPSIAPRGTGDVSTANLNPVLRAATTGKIDPNFLGRVAREIDKAHYEFIHGGSRRRFEAATNAIYEEMKRARVPPAMRELIGQRAVAAKINKETFFGGRIEDAVERDLGVARTTPEMRAEMRGRKYTDPHTGKELDPTADMEADHIYPVSKIMDLPGFKDLNWRQRMAVVHWRENIQPLPRELNNFKRDYLADEWNAKLVEAGKGPLDTAYLNKLRQRQADLEEALARRIACLRTSGRVNCP